MNTPMKLKQIIQEFNDRVTVHSGGRGAVEDAGGAEGKAHIYAQLRAAQAQNERYFKSYWLTLLLVFALTVGLAVVFRDEMGGLPVVLGAGGVIQGGLVVTLSNAWREKARVDIAAVLAVQLPAAQLQAVLKDLLKAL